MLRAVSDPYNDPYCVGHDADRYDVVWVVEDVGPRAGRRLRQVPEMVLAGDKPVGIATAGVP